jgi:hypothetical protein
MNTATLSRKVGELEKNVIGETPNPDDTYLGTNKKEEIELFRRANEIQEKQKAKLRAVEAKLRQDPTCNYDAEVKEALILSDEEETIVRQSDSIYTQRVMHLFDNAMAQHIHLNDPMNKYIFYARFYWFLSEMKEWLYLLWKEEQITREPGFFDLCHGEQNQKLKEVYDNWRKDWLSPESFERYSKKTHLTKTTEEIEQMLTNRTPEQIAQDEIEEQKDQEEQRKDEELDMRYLKEKCPTCPKKCDWYTKQTQREENQ